MPHRNSAAEKAGSPTFQVWFAVDDPVAAIPGHQPVSHDTERNFLRQQRRQKKKFPTQPLPESSQTPKSPDPDHYIDDYA